MTTRINEAAINQRAAKIGWICSAALPVGAIFASAAGLVPAAIGVPAALILFLLFGALIKRTIAFGLKLGVQMSVYGRVVLGIGIVGLIMMGASAPESRLGALIVPVVLSLLVLDRLCGYIGRAEMFESDHERIMQNEVDREFDLLKPLVDVPEPEPARNVMTMVVDDEQGRTVVPNTPVVEEGSFSKWMTGNKAEAAVGS